LRRKQSSTHGEGRPAASPRAGRPPRKRFGQHFLTDAAAIQRIVAAAALAPSDEVIEIGPGRGALTAALLASRASITAIEIDRDLARALIDRYPGERLRLIEADVLDVDLSALAGAAELVLVGNLPYNISKPIAMKLVASRRVVRRAVLMFQREVALRLTAPPGSRAYGPLSVICGKAFGIEALFDLPPGAFRPPPEVRSTVTRWTRREAVDLSDEAVGRLRAVLAASFAHRRRTIHNNLRHALAGGEAAAEAVLSAAGIDGALRAEALPPEAFDALAAAWPP
jgi:16S rRNA (adenine1518-N6/adenine1519-N6)-dimethyltransferase